MNLVVDEDRIKPGHCSVIPSVVRHSWLSDMKDSRSVRNPCHLSAKTLLKQIKEGNQGVLTELRFYVPPNTKTGRFEDILPSQSLG